MTKVNKSNKVDDSKSEHQRLYSLFMQTPAMIAVVKSPEMVFEFANPLYLKVVGKTASIIGKPVIDAMPELKGQLILKILQDVYRTGKSFIGNEVPVKIDTNNDGNAEDLYFNFVYQATKNLEGEIDGIMTHAVDVTEQVMARKKAEESEAKYKSLFNSIEQGFCVIEMLFDDKNRPVDYEFLETNNVFEKQTGLKNAVGKTVLTLLPDFEMHWIERYGKVALTGQPSRFTDGSEVMDRWFDVDASRVGGPDSRRVAVLFTDITDRKRAEQQQAAAAQQVLDVLESMGDAVFMVDKDWKIIRVNRVHEKVTKTKRQDVIGKHFWDVFPVDPELTSKYWIEHHKVMETRKPSHFVEYYEPLDLWTETDVYPTREGGISVFFRDISKRRRAEEALRRQLQITEAITNNATVCLFMIDTTGLVTYMNPAASQATGYSTEDVLGRPMHSLVHHMRPDGSPYPESECPLVLTYREGAPNPTHEDIFFRKDGSPFPALITGMPIVGASGVQATVVEFRDITEEKLSIENLKASEARLRFMAESMPQKVFTANADGDADYFNPQWMTYTGLSVEEITDWGWTQFIHPDDIEKNVRLWKRSIKVGEPFEVEHRIRGEDGDYHWHITRAHAMHDEAGAVIKWIGTSTDVDAVKRTLSRKEQLEELTASLKEQRSQLIALNEAKDEFISLASHQLRTPATGVKQYLGMLLQGYAGDLTESQHEFLRTADESNERQLRIVNDLLKVARVDSGKLRLQKETIDLVALVEAVIEEQAANFADRSQRISFTHKAPIVNVNVDQTLFRMVLENLIDNAHKYTDAGKNIRVKVRELRNSVVFSVEDEGAGIAAEDLDKLFQKFSRLDNPFSVSSGGTGLGLYLAKKVIDLHGGSISIRSELGHGTTFTLKLPISHE